MAPALMFSLTALLWWWPLAAAEGDSYEHTILENGLEVALLPGRATPVVILHLVLRYGAYGEAPGQNGWSHLHAQMLFLPWWGRPMRSGMSTFLLMGYSVV